MNTHSISVRILAAALLLAACTPSVGHQAPPASVVTAVFDPLHGQIPLPNDLALQPSPAGVTLAPAQQELLAAFAAQGGFPNDQEVPVTLSFTRSNLNPDGTSTNVAPNLDTTSLTPSTLAVFLQTATGSGTVALNPIAPTDYVTAGDHGVLTLHNKGRQPWTPGNYVVAVRGGPSGVKTAEGDAVYASQTFYLIAQGQNLESEQNLALLRAQAGSTEAALGLAKQLDALIANYARPFAAVNRVFPQQELAVMTTFAIAPARTQVQLDPGRGLVPLPIDLLRDPRPASASCPACGHLTPLAACTFAQGSLDAQGVCRDSKGNVNAAAAGFATLDGFSTTGLILAPTSGNITARTVTPSTVQLYDLSTPASPSLVPPTSYVTEPCEVTSSCSDHDNALSPLIALQPAGATAGTTTNLPGPALPSVFTTRPLKENADYAVVISDGVKDQANNSLAAGTVATVLQIKSPLVDAGGKSQLQGVDDPTAGALEIMRQRLAPTLVLAASNGIAPGHVAMAYTFHTESITSTAVQLAALPYSTPTSGAKSTIAPLPSSTQLYCSGATSSNPACSTTTTVSDAFSQYGIPAPHGHVGYLIDTQIVTFNKLLCNAGDPSCTDTGAFSGPTVQPVVEPIKALIALPRPPYGASNCVPTATAQCTIPLVIFRHGLGGGRAQMLALADTFTALGFGVAAIDAAKHGDRSYCAVDSECAAGKCVADPAVAHEEVGAGPTPGHCMNGTAAADFARRQDCGSCTNEQAVPLASSDFLVSANFFRTRDSLRQDLIDQSQLVRVLSPDPSGGTPGNLVTTPITGVQFDFANIGFIGQSLGAIQGTVDVAANPRFSRAVLNVGGATTVDIFTNSPAFSAGTTALLKSIGIQPGANAGYLQFLVVAKTILDPADPVNFAGHLQANTLPNLLVDQTGKTAQAKKAIVTQAAFCDQVVPNPFNFILDANAGTGPLPGLPGFGGPGTFQLFYTGSAAPTAADLRACPSPTSGSAPPDSAVSHGFLLDGRNPNITGKAQLDAATFLATGTTPSNSLVVIP